MLKTESFCRGSAKKVDIKFKEYYYENGEKK